VAIFIEMAAESRASFKLQPEVTPGAQISGQDFCFKAKLSNFAQAGLHSFRSSREPEVLKVQHNSDIVSRLPTAQ
jgi:hypothetical protein